VVEVGTWLGRSTVHLASGLRDAGFGESLWCFDRFIWDAQHARRTRLSLPVGASFQAEFERNVRPIYPGVRVSAGDLKEIVWRGGPIEILVLDAPKRLREISAALAIFGPHLVPGLSLVVFQDFMHTPSYSLPAVISCLGSKLRAIHVLRRSATVSFAVESALNVTKAQPVEWNFRGWSAARATATWHEQMDRLPPASRERLAPGLAMLLFDIGESAAACAYLAGLPRDEAMIERWRHYAEASIYERYRPLFDVVGVRPSIGKRMRLAREAWTKRRMRMGRAIAGRLRAISRIGR
jgi:hypothetical protein